jgi:hypothetical protein
MRSRITKLGPQSARQHRNHGEGVRLVFQSCTVLPSNQRAGLDGSTAWALVVRLTATVTATSAAVDSRRRTSTTVYVGTDPAIRAVVTPEKRKVGGSTPPLPTAQDHGKQRPTCVDRFGRCSRCVRRCSAVVGRRRVAVPNTCPPSSWRAALMRRWACPVLRRRAITSMPSGETPLFALERFARRTADRADHPLGRRPSGRGRGDGEWVLAVPQLGCGRLVCRV